MPRKFNFGGILGVQPNDTLRHLLIHRTHLKIILANNKHLQSPPSPTETRGTSLFNRTDHETLENFLKVEENKTSPRTDCKFIQSLHNF